MDKAVSVLVCKVGGMGMPCHKSDYIISLLFKRRCKNFISKLASLEIGKYSTCLEPFPIDWT